MIKVVIADDEEKVCQLIYHLVDWKSLDMEVVSIAHNGIEALEQVVVYKPDLIITDIRMPGYDGLEVIKRAKSAKSDIEIIIISGYRHFEYAQNAIKYGVGDYLLKPIKKTELLDTLNHVKEKYLLRTNQLTSEEQLTLTYRNGIDKKRTEFLACLLSFQYKEDEDMTVEYINRNYYYHFHKGLFQFFIFKLDCGYHKGNNSSLKLMKDKVEQITAVYIKEECYDFQIYSTDCGINVLCNYEPEKRRVMRKHMKDILDELLVQKTVFGQINITIGMGDAVSDLHKVFHSYFMAEECINERFVLGNDIFIEEIPYGDNREEWNTLLGELQKDFTTAIVGLNREDIAGVLEKLKSTVKASEAYAVKSLKIAKEVMQSYLTIARSNQLKIENEEIFYQNFCFYANRCGNSEALFHFLQITVLQSFDKVVEDKRQENTKPIRLAKQFILQNYKRSVSLEEVSSHVGFNASYFSSLFKKESGYNFLEYLSEVRMNKAKELLKETSMSVASVCEAVGYSDLKHFTKSFKKNTGLKPNEYRKLYS